MDNKSLKIFAAALLVAAPTVYAQSSLRQTAPRQQTTRQQAPRQQAAQQQRNTGTEVIALQTYVEGRDATYGVKPAEAIPVNPGDRVRIHLVGTAIINGNGVERRMPARFSVAAGRGQIDIVQSGADWALVQVNSRGDGVAQLGYEVTGNYEMKGGLKEGRITLQIGEGRAESSPVTSGPMDRNRWDRAEDLAEQLYRSILGAEPRGSAAREDIEHIYDMGAVGVLEVAQALAEDAGSRYDRLSQDQAVEVLGDLYRGLLRRSGSDNQLWDQDSGFRTNVDTLRRQGYEKIVQVIIGAPEFRTANQLSDFGSLVGRDDTSWRNDRGRYAVRDND